MNKCMFSGYLGDDAEIRINPDKTQFTVWRLGCTEHWTDKDGNRQSHTEWINMFKSFPANSKIPENLRSGRFVVVEGKFMTRKKDTPDGPRYYTQIKVDSVEFGPRPAANPARPEQGSVSEGMQDYPPEF